MVEEATGDRREVRHVLPHPGHPSTYIGGSQPSGPPVEEETELITFVEAGRRLGENWVLGDRVTPHLELNEEKDFFLEILSIEVEFEIFYCYIPKSLDIKRVDYH